MEAAAIVSIGWPLEHIVYHAEGREMSWRDNRKVEHNRKVLKRKIIFVVNRKEQTRLHE